MSTPGVVHTCITYCTSLLVNKTSRHQVSKLFCLTQFTAVTLSMFVPFFSALFCEWNIFASFSASRWQLLSHVPATAAADRGMSHTLSQPVGKPTPAIDTTHLVSFQNNERISCNLIRNENKHLNYLSDTSQPHDLLLIPQNSIIVRSHKPHYVMVLMRCHGDYLLIGHSVGHVL